MLTTHPVSIVMREVVDDRDNDHQKNHHGPKDAAAHQPFPFIAFMAEPRFPLE